MSASRPGVAVQGFWTYQQRAIEDVVSPILMSAESIANLERHQLEQRRLRTEQSFRLAMEMIRTGELFSAAVKVIRSRETEISGF